MFADQTASGIMEIRDWLELSTHNLDVSANINKDVNQRWRIKGV